MAYGQGKREHQKLKPYVVLQYLMKESDEQHALSAYDIAAYLEEYCGIDAERRSIYRDIDEINKVLYMLDENTNIQEAEEVIDEDIEGYEKTIVYDKSQKGFYVRHRKYEPNDIRLLAECVYATRFIEEKRSRKLIEILCDLVSNHQANSIRHDVFLTDRTKTANAFLYYNVSTINDAMRYGTREAPHTPEKISFIYQKHIMKEDGIHITGKTITVSPYRLMINDGNYYLLGYQGKRLSAYRVDRMKSVTPTGEPRDCEGEFESVDLHDYARCTFGMMLNTKKVRVTLLCKNNLLDTMLDRFGTKKISYTMVDDKYFSFDPEIELCHQFYGWLCGFGDEVKIISPDFVAEKYAAFLDKTRAIY